MSRIITMCKGCFPGAETPEHVTDHPLFSNTRGRRGWPYNAACLLYLHIQVMV